MKTSALSYALITPARNEAENLALLAESLQLQSVRPACWLIVDNGSTDSTLEVARTLADLNSWVRVLEIEGEPANVRGGPVVRAFEAGVRSLRTDTDVVVKLDADVSFGSDYFERLLAEFAEDPRLGIASGTCFEQEATGEWVERLGTGGSVWGATRAYRSRCLRDVQPLAPRMGWDGIDALRANLLGWTTRTIANLPFRHHRSEGERDGRKTKAWSAQGRASHYMGYRAWYLALRSLHHARREPAALAMMSGYMSAALRREPRYGDASVRAYLREQQSVRTLRLRMRQAGGREQT